MSTSADWVIGRLVIRSNRVDPKDFQDDIEDNIFWDGLYNVDLDENKLTFQYTGDMSLDWINQLLDRMDDFCLEGIVDVKEEATQPVRCYKRADGNSGVIEGCTLVYFPGYEDELVSDVAKRVPGVSIHRKKHTSKGDSVTHG